ncbi:MAG: hypothetical protein IT299_10480 [Dehalococcoidia bacterium]|nr:hypothetical protein [Dehalococcoidia bacterium]
MEIAPGAQLAAASTFASTGRASHVASTATFASSLDNQQQLEAARGVLTALPAPIVYSLRDRAGSPAESVDRLFEVLKDGTFSPPPGPLGAPDSIIGATAHAATLFDSPAQLWSAMRAAIGDPSSAATAMRGTAPAPASEAAGPPAEALPEVHNLEDAERLLTQLRSASAPSPSSPLPISMSERDADWWEAALRFLLGGAFPA